MLTSSERKTDKVQRCTRQKSELGKGLVRAVGVIIYVQDAVRGGGGGGGGIIRSGEGQVPCDEQASRQTGVSDGCHMSVFMICERVELRLEAVARVLACRSKVC